MSDGDILISTSDAARALKVAIDAGLVPRFPLKEWPPRFSASKSFAHPSGWEVDLHTNVMHEYRRPGADDDVWAFAHPVMVGQASTLTLAPEDHVLHVIVHGFSRNALSPVRWVTDAAMVIRHARNTCDWARLLSRAEQRRVSLAVGNALRYLRDGFNVDVPDGVLSRLGSIPIGLAERVEYGGRLATGVSGAVARRLSGYVRTRAHVREWQGSLGFLRYMRDAWNLESSWQLPQTACRKTIERLAKF